MLRKLQRCFILLFIISVSMVLCEGNSLAALTVKLLVSPNRMEIDAGSERIVLTARASGKQLTFKWELRGSGKLDEKGPAAFYLPPDTIEQGVEGVLITVTVTDGAGQEATESVTFKILARSNPASDPTSPPTEKKGMSMGTKAAIGVGAAAALGGGIALVTNDDGESGGACAGTTVGGYCWYLGTWNESCNQLCASHGGYDDEGTRTYAGSGGTTGNCQTVLTALGAPPNSEPDITVINNTHGCYVYVYDGYYYWFRGTAATDPDDRYYDLSIACACKS